MTHLFGDSMGRLGWCVRALCLIGLAVFSTVVTGSALAGESDASLGRLWRVDPSTPPPELQRDAPDETRELVTLEDAVALALQANRLVKSPQRLQLIAETVRRAYADVVAAHQTMTAREEQVRASLGVERLIADMAYQGKTTPSAVLHAQVALARAIQGLQGAREALDTQTRQLNHLMGRDLLTRLRVRAEPDVTPSATLRAGSAAVRGE
jgi:hypothetical protein